MLEVPGGSATDRMIGPPLVFCGLPPESSAPGVTQDPDEAESPMSCIFCVGTNQDFSTLKSQ